MPPRPTFSLIRGTGAAPRPAPGSALELLAVGTGLVLVCVLLARLGSWRAELGTFQSLAAMAFVFYAFAVWRAARTPDAPHAAACVLIVAVAARLALLPVMPTLSDDIHRYVWEGRALAHGHDPYRAAPLDPSLGALRDREVLPRVNHPQLAAIYPPLALAGFALVAKLSPTWWAMKLWIVAHDLALVVLLLAWARRNAGGPVAALAYAWNPLVLVEFAGSGHHDPTAMVWMVAALMLVERRPVGSALALAAGVLVKLAPLVALPLLWRRWPWRARAVALTALGAGLGFYWLETRGADSGLGAYTHSWRNNELAFLALERLLGDQARARLAVAAIIGLVALGLAIAARSPAAGTRTTLRAALLLSPVVHPWYVSWELAFQPLRLSAPWLLLSLTVLLSYGAFAPPREGGAFHPPLAWRVIEYGAPLLLAAALAWRARRPRRG